MKKLILFDLDGTLLDTLEDLGAAVNHALEARGLTLHTADEYRRVLTAASQISAKVFAFQAR